MRAIVAVAAVAAVAALSLATIPARATTFTDGEFVTWSQVAWGDTPAPGNVSYLLETNFNSLFAPSDLLEVGVPGPAGFSIIFDSGDSVITYLPASGPPGTLTADLDDPITSTSGALGGEVLTATLNVTFSDAGLLPHPVGVAFGNLLFQNLASLVGNPAAPGIGPEIAALDGMTVREVLSDANLVLGGSASPFTPADMFELLNSADMSFNGGPVSDFAREYLALPPSPVPEPSTWAMLIVGLGIFGCARRLASSGARTSKSPSA